MIRLSLLTDGPVSVDLDGPFAGVTLTVRRLTSIQFADARAAAADILRRPEALVEVLHRNALAASVRDVKKALTDPAFQTGLGVWLAAVECCLLAFEGWSGVSGEDGAPAPLSREALELLCLDEGFRGQAVKHIDAAARLLAVEANFSQPSGNGGAAAPPTPGGRNGAGAA